MERKRIIETVSLFPELNAKLIELLKGMDDDEWRRATHFPNWKVKDIVAHLLDTSIRRLSLQRDGYSPEPGASISSYKELVRHITNMADRWAAAFAGVSPQVLIEMVEEYQDQLVEFLHTLDPFGIAHFSVAWAGEDESYNWFDIAREYTERWHHQMQIRDVLNKAPLYERRLYYPLLDTFMQALPYHYRKIFKKDGYILCVHITGDSGGKWYLVWKDSSWKLMYDLRENPDTTVSIENAAAWKIFTKWINKSAVGKNVEISGDDELGKYLLDMTCIMI